MDDRIQPYRQPMVTAAGIILGFLLNFAAQWVKTEPGIPDWIAYVVGALLLLGVACLIVTLARILRFGVEASEAPAYYARTLTFFVVGVSAALLGALIDMFGHFLVE